MYVVLLVFLAIRHTGLYIIYFLATTFEEQHLANDAVNDIKYVCCQAKQASQIHAVHTIKFDAKSEGGKVKAGRKIVLLIFQPSHFIVYLL